MIAGTSELSGHASVWKTHAGPLTVAGCPLDTSSAPAAPPNGLARQPHCARVRHAYVVRASRDNSSYIKPMVYLVRYWFFPLTCVVIVFF